MPHANSPRLMRAGSVMLELLVSIAIFVGAAGFTLSAMRSALDGTRRAELRARALDLAQTRLAQLDAGLISAGELGSSTPSSSSSDDATNDLEVTVEFTPSPSSSSLAHARATVREMKDGVATSTVLTIDRLVGSDERESGSSSR